MSSILLTEQEKLKNCLDAFEQNGPFSHFKVISGGGGSSSSKNNQEESAKINDTITDYTNYIYMHGKSGINNDPADLQVTNNQTSNLYDYADDEEEITEDENDEKMEIYIDEITNYDNNIGDSYYEEDNYYYDDNDDNMYVDFE